MLKKDNRIFVSSFLRNPLKVGSVVPSSKTLARALAEATAFDDEHFIVELGAGTGIVTRELLERGVPPQKLVIIERDKKLHAHLVKQFPGSHVILGDARHLSELLKQHGIGEVCSIISSLPLLSMPSEVRFAILKEVFSVLPPQGYFTQFTYGLHSPVPKGHCRVLSITGQPLKRVWRNFPPALIWRFEQAQAA